MRNITSLRPALIGAATLLLVGCALATPALASADTAVASCRGIDFTVKHNDRTGGVSLSAGHYQLASSNIDCHAATADFASVLRFPTTIPGWTARQLGSGYARFSKTGTTLYFTAKRTSNSTGTSPSPIPNPIGSSTCRGITFSVLHNDLVGNLTLPAGTYQLASDGITCKDSSDYFNKFLTNYPHQIPGWTAQLLSPGYARFTAGDTGLSFTVRQISVATNPQ